MTVVYGLAAGAVVCVAIALIRVARCLDSLVAVARLHAERIERIEGHVDNLRVLARKRVVAGRSGR